MPSLAILLTAHNRKDKTLACLEAVFNQRGLSKDLVMQILLVDDGCSDGTPEAVQAQFPTVRILPGTGNLFWCGGMRLAFGTAIQEGFDFYLWLNDDTIILPDAFARLLIISSHYDHKAIIAASIKDPKNGELTYGGVRRLNRWKPLRFSQIMPEDKPIPVETMNGNFVLIPSAIAQKNGNLDSSFIHGLGDYDYGLRARKNGFEIYLAPGHFGHCQRNKPAEKTKSRIERLKMLLSPKELSPKPWFVFAKRYAGFFWPVFWLSPYMYLLISKGSRQ